MKVVDPFVQNGEQFEEFSAHLRMRPHQIDRLLQARLAGEYTVGDSRNEHVQQVDAHVRGDRRREVAMRRRGGGDTCRCARHRRRAAADRSPVGTQSRARRLAGAARRQPPEIRPALTAVVHVVEIETRFVEEFRKSDVWSLAAERSKLVDLGRPPGRDGFAQATQHDLRGHRVELHMTTGGKERELELHRSFDVSPRSTEKRPVAAVKAELLTMKCRRNRAPCRRTCRVILRNPRPSCCRNSVGLSVGRSISTVSTAGTSTPSLNRSTENTIRTRPCARSRSAPSRSDQGLSPQIATAGMSWRLKWWAMKRACSTLTQKPSARIVDGSACSATCCTTSRAHASELV